MAGNLSDFVSITVTENSAGISTPGFGTAMVLSYNAAAVFGGDLIRYYSNLLGVAGDFPDTSSPEYRAAQAYFGQSPHPPQLAIGKGVNKPTMVYIIGVQTVINAHVYTINVAGQDVTSTVATYTSSGGDTNDGIVAGLVTALNAVTGKNYTAVATGSTGSHVITVTANAAGNWFSMDLVNLTDLNLAITHVDPGIATDLNNISVVDSTNWYGLVTLFNSNSCIQAAAAWTESNTKVYIADCPNTLGATASVGGGGNDALDNLYTAAYTRTAGVYHPRQAEMFAASWFGNVLPLDPGSETWKFKTLAGVPAVNLSATNRVNIRAKKGNSYETVAGRNITWEGTTSDGNFLDVRRGLDWLESDMTAAVFGALVGASKIPYTDAGVALIENEIRGSLNRAVARGVLASTPAPEVTAPLVADVPIADVSTRVLPDITFTGTLAGAVHTVQLIGVVSV